MALTMEWSPQDAMKAFLQTLHLSKENKIMLNNEEQKYGIDGSKVIELQGTELISALAAGNKARIILDITSHQKGVTPSTLALAVAAKQTQGKLICIRPTLHHSAFFGFNHNDASDGVTELRVGDPCDLINDIGNVDFAVIDCTGFESSWLRQLSEKLHLNPRGAIIVANNIKYREQGVVLIDQILKGKKGVESSVKTLPLGSSTGFQLIIKIKSKCQRRKHNRFLVTFDD